MSLIASRTVSTPSTNQMKLRGRGTERSSPSESTLRPGSAWRSWPSLRAPWPVESTTAPDHAHHHRRRPRRGQTMGPVGALRYHRLAMEQLQGRTAVVTGAASGIGLAVAEAFVAAGMRVVMADVDEDALRSQAARLADEGAEILAVPADVRDPDAVERIG